MTRTFAVSRSEGTIAAPRNFRAYDVLPRTVLLARTLRASCRSENLVVKATAHGSTKRPIR